jgi:hypothetical protein
MAESSAFYYKQKLATPISAEANMTTREVCCGEGLPEQSEGYAGTNKANVKRSGQSQNWLVDYVNKANNGGIERVLL